MTTEQDPHTYRMSDGRLHCRCVEPTLDTRRYQRLRVLGAAPYGTRQLDNGTVLRFSGLDEAVDADLSGHPSRGEARPGIEGSVT